MAEHSLAVLHGLGGALLGAAVWSGAAAVFDAWSLLAAPGVGWLAAWSCSRGTRPDGFGRAASWVLGTVGILCGLLAYCAFSVAHASPDSEFQLQVLGAEYLRLLSAPPWFGSAAVLLALAGVPRALAARAPRASLTPVPRPERLPAPAPRRASDESRAA